MASRSDLLPIDLNDVLHIFEKLNSMLNMIYLIVALAVFVVNIMPDNVDRASRINAKGKIGLLIEDEYITISSGSCRLKSLEIILHD